MKMLPRLQAEEKLAAIDVAALAAGALEPSAGRRMMEELRRSARGGRNGPRARASKAQLGMIGIGVTIVPPPQEAANG